MWCMHGFDNMSFCIVWSIAKYFPSKGSWENVLTPTTPDSLAVLASEQSPSTPLRTLSVTARQPSDPLVPIVLSILGLPISAIAPSAPTPFLVTWCSQRTFPGPGLLLPAAVDEHTEAAPQTHITHRELNLAQPPRPEIPASVKKGPVTSLAFTSVGLSPYPQDKACPAFGTWVNLKILQLKVNSIPHSRIMIQLYHRKSMDLGCVIWLLG